VEPSRWLVDIRSKTLAVLPLSTAGGAIRKAAEGALNMRSILVEGDLIAVGAVARSMWAGRRVGGVGAWPSGCTMQCSTTACTPHCCSKLGACLFMPHPPWNLCAACGEQAEVQSVRADGQVQLHVRDAVASKLPPGMLVSVPPTLVRPQRKHVHHCAAPGELHWGVG